MVRAAPPEGWMSTEVYEALPLPLALSTAGAGSVVLPTTFNWIATVRPRPQVDVGERPPPG